MSRRLYRIVSRSPHPCGLLVSRKGGGLIGRFNFYIVDNPPRWSRQARKPNIVQPEWPLIDSLHPQHVTFLRLHALLLSLLAYSLAYCFSHSFLPLFLGNFHEKCWRCMVRAISQAPLTI